MISGQIFDIKRYALHDGPGIRTTVFFKGCPMHCRWCHNPEGITETGEIIWRIERCKRCDDCLKACTKNAIVEKNGIRYIDKEKCDLCGDCLKVCNTETLELVGNDMSVDKVMEEIEKDLIFYDESGGGVTFSGGEPMNQPGFLNSLLSRCKELDIHTTLDTSGYCSYQAFKKIQDKVDLFLFDLKCIDNYIHKLYTGVSNKIILENLKKLYLNGRNIHLRISVIPGVNDDESILDSTIDFISGLKRIKKINLLPYHKMGIDKFKRLHDPEFVIQSFTDSDLRINSIKEKFELKGISVKIGG